MDDFAPILAVLIVFGFVTKIIKMSLDHQKQKLDIKANAQTEASYGTKNLELLQEVSVLKERVAVLEKIVTADKYDLEQEFDKLGAS